ncbi:MAG: hypothetical protein M1814_003903 [Vezdaea aestivalis]|nr:MAG: hypothetical protein M1814_003903 [Vezdaea aestivalis]
MAPKHERPHPEGKYHLGDKKGRPTPARHIPWPEIFKHHISLCTGHIKFLEMIEKHCEPESDNWRGIHPLVVRAREMNKAAQQASRVYVPSQRHFNTVPLGSASDSMYPGYSPGDFVYGEAAHEAALVAAEADRVKNEQNSLNGNPATAPENKPSASFSTDQRPNKRARATENSSSADAKPQSDAGNGGDQNPYFIVDTNPEPLNVKNQANESKKRSADAIESAEVNNKRKSRALTETRGDAGSKKGPEPPLGTASDHWATDETKEPKRRRDSLDFTITELLGKVESEGSGRPKKKRGSSKVNEEFKSLGSDVNGCAESSEQKEARKQKKRARQSQDSLILELQGKKDDEAVEKPKKKKAKKDRQRDSPSRKRNVDENEVGEHSIAAAATESDGGSGKKKKKNKKNKAQHS